MKKRWLCAFIALFFLVCSVPLTAMCLAGPAPAAANEIAAPKPKLIRRGTLNTAFLSELSAYASRGFRPRLWCITAWDAVCARLFGASALRAADGRKRPRPRCTAHRLLRAHPAPFCRRPDACPASRRKPAQALPARLCKRFSAAHG